MHRPFFRSFFLLLSSVLLHFISFPFFNVFRLLLIDWIGRVFALFAYLSFRMFVLRPGFDAWRAGEKREWGGAALLRRRRLTFPLFRVVGLSHGSGDVRVGHAGILAVRRGLPTAL